MGVDGRAALIVSDNVLFDGGAGEKLRRRLLKDCHVHTFLRLSTGILYAAGVKANVLFFDRKRPEADGYWMSELWVYDFRIRERFTPRQRELQRFRFHLDKFVELYCPGTNREATDRFKVFTIDEQLARDNVNLDIIWLHDPHIDGGGNLPPSELIVQEILENLQIAKAEREAKT